MKMINPRVFEKTIDDADHSNVLAEAGNSGTHTTDSADVQFDLDSRLRRLVKRIDHLLVDQRITLGTNKRMLAVFRVFSFDPYRVDE